MKTFLVFVGVCIVFCHSTTLNAQNAQWKQIGPIGANISEIFRSDSTLYLNTSDNGVMYSTNQGVAWKPLDGNNADKKIVFHTNTVWIARDNRDKIWRSENKGQTWQQFDSIPTNDVVRLNAIVQLGDVLVAAISGLGVYHLYSDGRWKQVDTTLRYPIMNGMVAVGNTLYVADYRMVSSSVDSGKTWKPVGKLPNPDIRRIWSVGNQILITGYTFETNETWLLQHGDTTWRNISKGLGTAGGSVLQSVIKYGSAILGVNSYGVYQLKEQDTAWVRLSPRNGVALFQAFDKLFLGDASGLSVSHDMGLTWQPMKEGFPIRWLHSVLASDSVIVASTPERSQLFSTDNGLTWQKMPSSASGIVGKRIYSLYNEMLVSSDDYGQTVQYGPRVGYGDGNCINSAEKIDEHNDTIFIAGYCIAYASSPSRRLYRRKLWSVDKPTRTVREYGIYSNAESWIDGMIHTTQATLIAVGCGISSVNRESGKITSRIDNGTGGCVRALAKTSRGILAGTASNGLMESVDDGATWQFLNNSLSQESITSLARKGSTVVASTANRVFYSQNDGLSWMPMSRDTLQRWIQSVHIVGNDVVVENYAGLWKMPLPQAVSVQYPANTDNAENIENALTLVCSPNPVHDLCRVRYVLPIAGRAELSLHSVFGQKIELAKREYQAGAHEYIVDTQQLSAGHYQLILKTQAGIARTALVIVK